MKKAKPQGQPQSVVVQELADAKGHGHNQVVDTAAPSKTPELPTHPALSFWDINRKLNKLEESYRRDQEKKPAEIESSSVVNPRVAAIFWMIERLKQYVEEIETVYETEIEAGRLADAPDLWAAVYTQKILPSASAKIGSLMWNLTHKLWLAGGGGPGEQASVEEAQRELSRLRAQLECELARACSCAEEAKADMVSEIAMNDSKNSPGVTRAMLVERIRREIIAISRRTELQEDYDDNIRGGKGNFSSSVTVSVCDQHNDLCNKLCAIKTTPKPKIVDLACEIAARVNGNAKSVLPKTFLDAHKRYGAEARERLDQRQ